MKAKPELKTNWKLIGWLKREHFTRSEAIDAIREDLSRSDLVTGCDNLHHWHYRFNKADDWEETWEAEVDAAADVARAELIAKIEKREAVTC